MPAPKDAAAHLCRVGRSPHRLNGNGSAPHCGTLNAGRYVGSLAMTDGVSGWTECVPVVVRSRELIVDTVERLRQALPLALLSRDTDNGMEFANEVLVDDCAKHGFGLTRSRPYFKNDQARIEQKNGAVVSRLVGYA